MSQVKNIKFTVSLGDSSACTEVWVESGIDTLGDMLEKVRRSSEPVFADPLPKPVETCEVPRSNLEMGVEAERAPERITKLLERVAVQEAKLSSLRYAAKQLEQSLAKKSGEVELLGRDLAKSKDRSNSLYVQRMNQSEAYDALRGAAMLLAEECNIDCTSDSHFPKVLKQCLGRVKLMVERHANMDEELRNLRQAMHRFGIPSMPVMSTSASIVDELKVIAHEFDVKKREGWRVGHLEWDSLGREHKVSLLRQTQQLAQNQMISLATDDGHVMEGMDIQETWEAVRDWADQMDVLATFSAPDSTTPTSDESNEMTDEQLQRADDDREGALDAATPTPTSDELAGGVDASSE